MEQEPEVQDHIGELIFFLRGNKIKSKLNVDKTRNKIKNQLIQSFSDR